MSTNKRLLIDSTHTEETRVIIADETRIHEFDISASSKTQNKGNIYLAKITRVEPSLQAAFVEYGGDRQGFLPFSEIHPDYYQIPVADRKKLIEEAAAEEAQEEEDEEQEQNTRGNRGDKSDRGGRRGRGRRRGGRGRTDNRNAEENEDGETGAADAKDGLTAEDIANTYLEEPISDSPSVKSEIVEDLLEDIKEARKEEKSESDRAEDEDGSDEAEEVHTAGEEKSEVESLGDDDEFTRRRKASFLRRYKIQEVIKRNQVMLVQVIKEERGNKGASLSTYISLAGRYCVLMPNSPKTGGISRKISSNEDRKRLKAISEEIRSSNGMSAIIRTAGIDRTRAEIKRDYDYLIKLWSQIRELTLSSTAPALVYEEANIVKRSLRDLYSSDIKEIVVAGEDAYRRSKEFMKLMMPSHAARVKLHNEATPIFYAYDVEDQLLRMHEPQVKLESGGSIVLNPTEALVSIDVNSGRSTTERNVEETAVKTNLEAAQEIARQVRLRDLAGLIVIDFIDMFDYKNRRAVERQLKEALKADRAKIQLGRISAFGLLEMSRQRLRPSLTETNTLSCPHCDGRGFILNADAQGIQMLRFLEKEASSGEYAQLKLKVPAPVALYLLNNKRDHLMELEKTHNLKISIEIGEGLLSAASFMLERYATDGQKTEVNGMDGIPTSGKRNRPRKRKRERGDRDRGSDRQRHASDSASSNDNEQDDEEDSATAKPDTHADGKDGERRRRRRGGRRRGGRNRDERQQDDDTVSQPTSAEAAPEEKAAPVAKSEEVKADGETKEPAKEKAEKKPAARKRAARPKKADAEAEKPAAKEEKPESRKPAAAASAPSAPREHKELESVGVGDGSDEKKGNRKGWWRRIVE